MRTLMLGIASFLVIAGVAVLRSNGDVLVTKSGHEYEGQITEEDDSVLVVSATGAKLKFPKASVAEIRQASRKSHPPETIPTTQPRAQSLSVKPIPPFVEHLCSLIDKHERVKYVVGELSLVVNVSAINQRQQAEQVDGTQFGNDPISQHFVASQNIQAARNKQAAMDAAKAKKPVYDAKVAEEKQLKDEVVAAQQDAEQHRETLTAAELDGIRQRRAILDQERRSSKKVTDVMSFRAQRDALRRLLPDAERDAAEPENNEPQQWFELTAREDRFSDVAAIDITALSYRDIENGWTAMHYACAKGRLDVAKRLLEMGMSPDPVTPTAQLTPLFFAVSSGNKPLVELLIEKGANVNAASVFGTPLFWASAFGDKDIVALLIERHAGVNVIAHYTPADRGHGHKQHGGKEEETGNTPLHVANDAEVTKVLIAAGANVNARNSHGTIPLHVACGLLNQERAKYLLANGAEPQAATTAGGTPLIWTAMNGTVCHFDEQEKNPSFLELQTTESRGESRQETKHKIMQEAARKGFIRVTERPYALNKSQDPEQMKLANRRLEMTALLVAFGAKQRQGVVAPIELHMPGIIIPNHIPENLKTSVSEQYRIKSVPDRSAVATTLPAVSDQEKAATSLLQMGDSLRSAGRLDLAQAKYESVIARYPATEAAKKAKERLNMPPPAQQ